MNSQVQLLTVFFGALIAERLKTPLIKSVIRNVNTTKYDK